MECGYFSLWFAGDLKHRELFVAMSQIYDFVENHPIRVGNCERMSDAFKKDTPEKFRRFKNGHRNVKIYCTEQLPHEKTTPEITIHKVASHVKF